MNAESPTSQSPDERRELAAEHRRKSSEIEENGGTLVDRVEAAKRAASQGEVMNPETTDRPRNWESRVKIMKSRARTVVTLDRDLGFEAKEEVKKAINSLVVISDNEIPDAHNNEITESQFRKRYKIESIED